MRTLTHLVAPWGQQVAPWGQQVAPWGPLTRTLTRQVVA